VLAEPELNYDAVFYLSQFSCCAAFDGEDIPSGTVRRGAFRRVYQRWVFMQAATVTPTVGPSCLKWTFIGPCRRRNAPIIFTSRGWGSGDIIKF
jgi:hypothetical protein